MFGPRFSQQQQWQRSSTYANIAIYTCSVVFPLLSAIVFVIEAFSDVFQSDSAVRANTTTWIVALRWLCWFTLPLSLIQKLQETLRLIVTVCHLCIWNFDVLYVLLQVWCHFTLYFLYYFTLCSSKDVYR